MAVSFHEVAVGARMLACDECGSLVDPSEQGRAKHQRTHDVVVDLTGEVQLLRTA